MKKDEIEQHPLQLPGGKKSLIEFSRRLFLDGPDPRRPLRAEVTIALRSPGPTGMPEGADAVELDNVAYLALKQLTGRGRGEHALTVTGAGARVLICYLPERVGLLRKRDPREVLTPALERIGREAGRELAVTFVHEPGWDRLLGIYPAHDPAQWQLDRALLMHMIKAGDAVHARREVAHKIYFPSRDASRDFLRQVRRLKLESRGAPRQLSEDRWVVMVSRLEPTLVTWHLHPVVLNVKAAAAAHGGTYDGWEAELVPSLVPPPLTGPRPG